MVFVTPIFQIIALYLEIEGAKNIHVPKVQIMGFGGNLRFLTKGWHLNLGLNMVTGLWYTQVLNFGTMS